MNLSSCQIKEIKSHLYLPALKIKDAPMHSMDRFPIHCSGMKGFVKLAADVPFFAVLTADDTRRRESRRVVEYETDTERERRAWRWRGRGEAAEKQHEQKSDQRQGGKDDKSASHGRRHGVRRGRSAELRGGGRRRDHEVRTDRRTSPLIRRP